MRSYDAATLTALQARTGLEARHLVWITARNRSTGDPESVGFWGGPDDLSVTIGGDARVYIGAGALLTVDPITSGVGLDVRMLTVALAPADAGVQDAIRLYDARLAPVEVHRALFNPSSGAVIGAPHRVFRGWCNEAVVATGAVGEVRLSLASAARALTRGLTLKRSAAALQDRAPGDRFRDYVDIAGEIPVWWGERKHTRKTASVSPEAPTPPGNDDWWREGNK